ncbi:4-hydroxy-tetrahydrodipicolinate synthase [Candidatus Hydrogenosomobacter endosymbioticus]|uniref:4-hydroxy-tetrahydrodipicolinate synthase n=1 Tax=Candidatus Hydrogenosomobacter endosymbioticus TaxID=2558174 RepID=A0ABM7V881_9PROT|nr:4-hydroxy-tetrahydrodipicolinate synthase [Candidatus Hydrogenosomobacter endosymbioticus]BDB95975.1 4-hydroxy-tetrahydrodipicolinate synthase [Candidatus Hydrogenosomobacter endosymbioticus]
MSFNGVSVAVPTFMLADRAVNWSAFEKYIDWLCGDKVDGVVPCGTTGGFLCLSADEQRRLIEICVEVCGKRAKVIAGAAAATTPETINLVKSAEKAGANAALIVSPFYVKPSQEGIYQFYKDIHDATNIPIVIYSNPGRAGVGIAIDTVKRLMELPRIVGLKDSTSDLSRTLEISSFMKRGFSLLCGEDSLFLPFLSCGGTGIISVTAGVAPMQFKEIWKCWNDKDIDKAHKTAISVRKLCAAMFMSPSPIPVKYALYMMGFAEPHTRLPLGPISCECKSIIKEELASLGLCNSCLNKKCC